MYGLSLFSGVACCCVGFVIQPKYKTVLTGSYLLSWRRIGVVHHILFF
jgi:hypothetical protein